MTADEKVKEIEEEDEIPTTPIPVKWECLGSDREIREAHFKEKRSLVREGPSTKRISTLKFHKEVPLHSRLVFPHHIPLIESPRREHTLYCYLSVEVRCLTEATPLRAATHVFQSTVWFQPGHVRGCPLTGAARGGAS